MNPLGATILCVLLVVVIAAPRHFALLGMFASVLYLTYGVQLTIGGFNMFGMRFIELGAFARVILRREFSFAALNKLDRIFIFLNIFTTLVFLLRSEDGQVFQIGVAVDALLTYFIFRGLLTDFADFRLFCTATVFLLVPFTLLVLVEASSHQNPFNIMGGVINGDWLREGRLRCVGSFRHPSLLGTLGASLIPLYVSLILSRFRPVLASIGILLCLIIIVAANSGGPLNAAAVGVVGWALWNMRRKMQFVRRLILFLIIALGLSMKAPIWYVFARLSALSGGDGWHRSYLMDVAYQNLGKWWAVGMPITETWDWFPYGLSSTGGADITNIYVGYGLTAGLGSMGLFIFLLVHSYRCLGKRLTKIRLDSSENTWDEYMAWGLGVVLTVHIVNWFGITYFDQTMVLWLLQFAAISTFTSEAISRKDSPSDSRIYAPHAATLRSF